MAEHARVLQTLASLITLVTLFEFQTLMLQMPCHISYYWSQAPSNTAFVKLCKECVNNLIVAFMFQLLGSTAFCLICDF